MKTYTVILQIKLEIETEEQPEKVLTELSYSFSSNTETSQILETEILDWQIEEQKE